MTSTIGKHIVTANVTTTTLGADIVIFFVNPAL